MLYNAISALFFIACVLAVSIVNYKMRRSKAVYLCDYQAGLLFENGDRWKVLSPGNHFTNADKEPITVVDMRPYQFIIERFPFKDKFNVASLISVGGEFMVSDPQLAVRSLKKIFDESFSLIRENLGPAASRFVADSGPTARQQLAAHISGELNNVLRPKGIELSSLQVTELWSLPVAHSAAQIAN